MVSLGSCGLYFFFFSLPFSCFFLQTPCFFFFPLCFIISIWIAKCLPTTSPGKLFQIVQMKPPPSFDSVLCVSRLRRKTLLIGQSVYYLPLSQLNVDFCPILINWRIGGILQDCEVSIFNSSAWIDCSGVFKGQFSKKKVTNGQSGTMSFTFSEHGR